MSRIEKAKVLRAQIDASIEVAKKYVRVDELSEDELSNLVVLYSKWNTDVEYKVDDIVQYDGTLYRVIQDHKSQADWTPDKVPAMFDEIVPEGVIPEWKQPTGGHDAYKKGDKVIFKGDVYESLVDGNAHSPEANPKGWELVEDK